MPKVERAQLRTRLLTECGDFTEIDGELQCKFCTTKVCEVYGLKCLEVLIHDIAFFFQNIFARYFKYEYTMGIDNFSHIYLGSQFEEIFNRATSED